MRLGSTKGRTYPNYPMTPGILWYAFVALCLIAGAVFSPLVWMIYHKDRKDAIAFRESVTTFIDAPLDQTERDVNAKFRTEVEEFINAPLPDAAETEITREEFDEIRNHVFGISQFLNEDMAGLVADMKKIAPKIDGAIGRATRAAKEGEDQFIEGMDALADEQLIAALPAWGQAVAGQIMESGDPRVMTWLRTWMSKRPEIRAALAPQQAQLTNAPDAYSHLRP